MGRRYHRRSEPGLDNLLSGIVSLAFLGSFVLYYTNRAEFWRWVWYGAGFLGVLILGFYFFRRIRRKRSDAHKEEILRQARESGFEEEVKTFIVRFGRAGKGVNAFEYRGYRIDWKQIDTVRDDFARRGLELSSVDFSWLLRQYIDEREDAMTLNSIKNPVTKFDLLDGTAFEHLLGRLYEKMGYAVQMTGKTGDQGGDLVATRAPERIVIQAKCYKNQSVGNAAVQEAAAARSMYDGNKAMVITTSDFTKEARELARATDVELISRKELQELLLKYLSETWG